MTTSTKNDILNIILKTKNYFTEKQIITKCKEQNINDTLTIKEILEELFETNKLIVNCTSNGETLYKIKGEI